MKRIFSIIITVICCLYSKCVLAQVSLNIFFSEIKSIVTANYSKTDLRKVKTRSDSSYTSVNAKKRIRQLWYSGMLETKEGANVEYKFFVSEFKSIGDIKCNGIISIGYDQCKSDQVFKVVLEFANKYNLTVDTCVYGRIIDSLCRIQLSFNNYSPATNSVLENVDSSLTTLIKHEYFDFYFADINKNTANWQKEFKTFMQPHSEALPEILKKGNLATVFKLMDLKNKSYSWFLAEGLSYYNSRHPCLTQEQIKIIETYNGKTGKVSFRSIEELEKIYNF